MDLLARGDSSHTLAENTGRDRCSVGKAWIIAARHSRERSAEFPDPQLLLPLYNFPFTGHSSGRPDAKGSTWFLPQLQTLSGFFAAVVASRTSRCSYPNG